MTISFYEIKSIEFDQNIFPNIMFNLNGDR